MKQTVWKVGSNWGDGGPSVLDLFLDYECVFFGCKQDSGIGSWSEVCRGDLFIVANGSVPAAIGIALGKFTSYGECGIRFRKKDADNFIDDNVVICPARLVLLSEKERGENWGMETRRRFCRADGAADKVREWWRNHESTAARNPFAIHTRVASLLVKGEKDDDTILRKDIKYHVPIYQRPYSWGEPELRRLMEDLHQGCVREEDAFLGTVQLSQPVPLSQDGKLKSYDIIDGQQRLTTFVLLVSILEKAMGGKSETLETMKSNFRTSVNRRTAQDDLEASFDFFDKGFPGNNATLDTKRNPYIDNAITLKGLLAEFSARRADGEEDGDDAPASDESFAQYAAKMHSYVAEHVKFVVLETHAGLSKTLKIFNTINSSGLDLGSEDLFKVRFYEYLKNLGDDEGVFDRISELYGRIDEYNRHPFVGASISMSQVLSTYQRFLIAKYNLGASLFTMSSEGFFNDLFDTALGIRPVAEFNSFAIHGQSSERALLSFEELVKIFQAHVDYLNACSKDPDLRIARRMIWETRYGYAADFPVLALAIGVATPQTVKAFAWGLVKALVPPSLYFAKHVYQGRAHLLALLKEMWSGEPEKMESPTTPKWDFNELTPARMIDASLDYRIAWTPKWKNLLCRLVEYIKSPQKDEALFTRLFQTGFDIEHIQSSMAEDEMARQELGWDANDVELDRIGNLAMFESELNRSVQNKQKDKQAAYGESAYVCLKELADKVSHWSKKDAQERRMVVAESIKAFLGLE